MDLRTDLVRRVAALVISLASAVALSACGDRAATLGNPCKANGDCDTGMMRGVCMSSVMSGGYCTLLCEKDEDCAKPGFVCGAAEVTTKGLVSTSKQDARYCTKK